jgi:Na+/pantothenate symporter
MFFSLASNILVVSSILIGGAAAINALTGMNVYASLWLLPLSVSAYTMRGGLRATILTDYVSGSILPKLQAKHVLISVDSHRDHPDHYPYLLVQGIRHWK